MTPAGKRGRGRPLIFDDHLREKYLVAVAGGMLLKDAARLVGVDPVVPRHHSRTDTKFGAAMTAAKAEGKRARDGAKAHGESHYNNQGCRHPECGAAARKGRAARRKESGVPGEVHRMRPEVAVSSALLLLEAS